MKQLFVPIAMAALALSAARAEPAAKWPDTFLSRVEALAAIQTLNAELLASRSATTTLEQWCADHKMAAQPRLVAERVQAPEKPASPDTRARLQLGPDEPLKYRRVRLSCGGHVLSEADNWYAPGRLSEETNRQLDTTDTPFGKAIRPMQPWRKTVEMKLLWSPLPQGWELSGPQEGAPAAGARLSVPHALFEHWAVVYSGEQKPISEVHETYTGDILDWVPAGLETPR